MRKLLFIALLPLLLLAALAPLAFSSSPSTKPQAPSAPDAVPGTWETVWRGTGSLNAFTCVDADLCFATGDAGLFLKTSDGGATWHYAALTPDHDLYALAFADPNHGLAVGQAGVVYRTADGGVSWQAGATPDAVDLFSVSLLADGRAWVAGAGGAIFASSDWGATWTAQTSNTAETLRRIQFLDANSGFAAGTKATVLATDDGGATWTALATTFPAWANIYALYFTSAQDGWIAGQAGLMRRTVDGGASWQSVTTGLETDAVDILDMHFSDAPGVGVIGGITGVIATSADGVTWSKRAGTSTNTRDVNAVYALGPADIWAGGNLKPSSDDGTRAWWINHSSDGSTFEHVAGDFGLYPHLEDVAFPTRDIGYVVGQGSSIGKTIDGGETWTWRKFDTGTNSFYFSAISCPTADSCWIGGRYGLVYATNDGGQTWEQQVVPGYGAPVYDIEMLDTDEGHLAGNPSMFRTSDGGEQWIASTTEGGNSNVEISMISEYEGWTALRNYSYRYTTSAGQTWKRVINDELNQGIYVTLQALDEDQNGGVDHVFLAGCAGPLVHERCPDPLTGIIAHTADGGGSWEYQPLPADTPPLKAIYMFDAKTGWAGAEQGVLIYTDSGGAAWEIVDSSLPRGETHITALDFAEPTRGLGSAFGGYIIRFTGPGRTLGSYQQPGAIIIDGRPGDWYQGGSLYLDADNASTVLGDEPFPTPADLSAEFYSRWTSPQLYLLAEISDDVVVDDGDILNLAIDGLNDNVWNGDDDHLLVIRADGAYTDTLHPDQTDAFAVGVGRSDDGWVVEVAVPAAVLQRTDFVQGDSVGFNISLEDDDGAGIEHTLVMEGRRVDADPATFGAIAVVGDAVDYQNGLLGYDGTEDTYLDRWFDQTGNTAYGQSDVLWTIYNRDTVYVDTLLRFELTNLPDNAQVLDATLELSIIDSRVDSPLTLGVHRMLREWNENVATWNQPDTDSAWGSPGALAPNSDYDSVVLDSITLESRLSDESVQWDVTSAVQAWLEDPASNHGLLLLPSGGARHIIARSSENSSASRRPKLIVRFQLQPRPGTPTPTPTPTLAPTATPTPTVTPSPTPTLTPTPVSSRVHGIIYEDTNANGIHDEGEPPIAGASVALTGLETEETVVTADDGAYNFDNLMAGNYSLDVTPPFGYGPANPATPLSLVLNEGNVLQLNFGHIRLYTPEEVYMPMIVQ